MSRARGEQSLGGKCCVSWRLRASDFSSRNDASTKVRFILLEYARTVRGDVCGERVAVAEEGCREGRLERASGVSYSQQAHDRYECDIWAVGRSGFDPTQEDGGVPPDAVPSTRADYLRAEAACFQARGYLVRRRAGNNRSAVTAAFHACQRFAWLDSAARA
jgi:hypothetical protein